MSQEEFQAHYLQEMKPGELPAHYETIREYHRATEEYDRAVCTGRAGKEAVPMGAHECALVNRFAVETKQRLKRAIGISEADWRAANNYYCKKDLWSDLETDWGRCQCHC